MSPIEWKTKWSLFMCQAWVHDLDRWLEHWYGLKDWPNIHLYEKLNGFP